MIMAKFMKCLKSAINFLFMLLVAIAFITFFLFDIVRPKDLINPYLISGVIVGAILFLLAMGLLIRKLAKLLKGLSKRSELIISIAFILIILVGVFTVKVIQHFEDKEIYAEALIGFVVVKHGSLTDDQIENTLVALQKQLTSLRNKYIENPPEYVIPVHIFTNLNEYRESTKRPDWSGASTLFNVGEPPILLLPSEKGGGLLDKTAPTTGPAHEITHVVEYEALGLKSMKLIPGSFHEGIAQYESLNQFVNLMDRIEKRFIVVINSDVVLAQEGLPDAYALESEVDVRLYYCVSFEFMRYMVDTYGENKPWEVLKIVGAGESFEMATTFVFNKSYSELFQEFKNAFFH